MTLSQDVIIFDPDDSAMAAAVHRNLGERAGACQTIESLAVALKHRFNCFSGQLVIVVLKALDGGATDQIAAFKAVQPGAIIVLLAQSYGEQEYRFAERVGLNGLLPLSINADATRKSLDLIRIGGKVFSLSFDGDGASPTARGEAAARVDASRSDLTEPASSKRSLSDTEREILSCLVDGLPNKLIARQCDMTEANVKIRLRTLLRKIGAANRTQAAVWALDHLDAWEAASPVAAPADEQHAEAPRRFNASLRF
ncbi:LuxR C-terminal-related transcriptional regulator [Jiella sp. M17.18]|uniref:helix-turn-helix transcriptional regulator n=1 Tax=Jiella sp. M17.18 TaxID=3234247 RepID=UPI0034DFBB5F